MTVSTLPHRIIEEAIYKHPGDWAAQLSYITSEANDIIKEQAELISLQQEEIFELKRNKVFLSHANRSLCLAEL